MADDHHDQPRGDSRAAARARRAQQRQQWERSEGRNVSNPGADEEYLTEAFANAFGMLLQAAAALPDCERAAGFREAVERISAAAGDRFVREEVRALAAASALDVTEEPWRRFHLAAAHLAAVLDTTGSRRRQE